MPFFAAFQKVHSTADYLQSSKHTEKGCLIEKRWQIGRFGELYPEKADLSRDPVMVVIIYGYMPIVSMYGISN